MTPNKTWRFSERLRRVLKKSFPQIDQVEIGTAMKSRMDADDLYDMVPSNVERAREIVFEIWPWLSDGEVAVIANVLVSAFKRRVKEIR